MELPLAIWAVLGMTIARARFAQRECRAEFSLTETQRRLGGAGRKTVVNVYVLEHPEAMRAAPETPWREEGLPQASGIPRGTGERPPAPPGAPERAPEASRTPGRGTPQDPTCGLPGGREGTFAGAEPEGPEHGVRRRPTGGSRT